MIVEPIQSNFSGGEVSPKLRAQTALEVVQKGVNRMENALAVTHGNIYGRDGFRKSGADVSRMGESAEKGVTFNFNVGRDDNYQVIIEPLTDAEIIANGGSHETEIRVIKQNNLAAGTEETFEIRYDRLDTLADSSLSKTEYKQNELEDIHFIQIKDQMIFVHSHHPPMRLMRYKKTSGDIRWGFTYLGTWGAEWGSGYQESTDTITIDDVEVGIGFPRCVAYYQQRIVYGGMTNNPKRLVFTRTDDFTVIDTGLIDTLTMPYNTYEAHFNQTKSSCRIMKLQGTHLDDSLIVVEKNNKILELGTGAGQYEIFRFSDEFSTWPAYAQAAESLVNYSEFLQTYVSRVQLERSAETYIQFGTAIDLTTDNVKVYSARPEDSAFTFDIASTTQDFIQWLAVGDGLFIGTTGGEWVAGAEIYMSAVNPPRFAQVSYYGSKHIQPVSIGDAMVYVTASG